MCSIKFKAKRIEKKAFFCCGGRHNGVIAILKHKKTKKDIFGVKSNFISLINTKSGVFTRGFASRENTAFHVHSMK